MFSIKSIIFLTIFSRKHLSLILKENNPYCDFECGEDHTVCKFSKNKCGIQKSFCIAENGPLRDKERDMLLSFHNYFRNEIANGSTPFGPSANMLALSYDKELEYVAQCWANTCTLDHDSCRITNKFDNVGQNFYIGNMDEVWMKEAVEGWFDAHKKVDNLSIDNYFDSVDPVDYGYTFTQLAWAATTHVGCGRIFKKQQNRVNVFCNYGPGGNVPGGTVFKRGLPCSNCPNGTSCNSAFGNLCGEIDSYEKSDDPFLLSATLPKISYRFVFLILAVLKYMSL